LTAWRDSYGSRPKGRLLFSCLTLTSESCILFLSSRELSIHSIVGDDAYGNLKRFPENDDKRKMQKEPPTSEVLRSAFSSLILGLRLVCVNVTLSLTACRA
jgi:hypothetical protein